MAAARKSKKRPWGFDRKHVVRVRVSDDEKRRILARATEAGLTLSAFVRQAALGDRGTGVLESVRRRVLRHHLRRVHTCLQQALLHAPAESDTKHLRRAETLLAETIREL